MGTPVEFVQHAPQIPTGEDGLVGHVVDGLLPEQGGDVGQACEEAVDPVHSRHPGQEAEVALIDDGPPLNHPEFEGLGVGGVVDDEEMLLRGEDGAARGLPAARGTGGKRERGEFTRW